MNDDATPGDPGSDDAPLPTDPASPEDPPPAAVAPTREPRSIVRDIALGAVVVVAVFILLGGIASLAARSGDRGARPTGSLAVASGSPSGTDSGAVGSASPSLVTGGSPASGSPDPADDPVLVGAGDIADCGLDDDTATAALLDGIEGTVFTAGDNAYPDGTPAQFRDCYGPTWGRHLARTRPAPGNHDWGTRDLAGYRGYFGDRAAPAGTSWYSYDLGPWHVVVLDSDCTSVGGCGPETTQGRWLAADLAASTARCTLAIWHHPRFSSGDHGNDATVAPFWTALYDAGADVVVNGHDHDYERFAAQDPNGHADAARGLREFVVGTGGAALRTFPNPAANSEVKDASRHGVIRFTLHAASYDWSFVPATGGPGDAGSSACH